METGKQTMRAILSDYSLSGGCCSLGLSSEKMKSMFYSPVKVTMLRFICMVAALILWLAPERAVGVERADEVVTVKVFSLPQKGNTEASNVAAYKVMQRFLELHPDVRLESSTTLKIEGDVMDAAPLMAIAAGTSPDIIYVNFRQSDTYISQGFLYPLDEYINELSPEELVERIPPSIKPVVYREGPDGQSHYWAMPKEIVAPVLLFRKDLFARAGLDPRKPPTDWKELEEAARKIADPGAGVYGLVFHTGANASHGISPYLSSAGAKAVVQLPDGQWKAHFDTPEAVAGYGFAIHLMQATVTKGDVTGALAYVGADGWSKILAGKVGMFFTELSESNLTAFDPEVLGTAPIPQGPTGRSIPQINARMLGIYAGVKDKRTRDAAWKYIKFSNSEEAHRIYTRTMVELGAAHMINPVWLEEFGYPELARLAPVGLIDIYRAAVRDGILEPFGKNCQFVYTYMSAPLEKLFYTKFNGMGTTERDAIIKRTLVEAVQKTNERMLGHIPPEARTKRNTTAWAIAAITGTVFVVFIGFVFKWMSRELSASSGRNRHQSVLAGIFVLPALFLILLWQYYPLARGSLMAFQDYNLMGASQWVGINNFADVLFDIQFWSSLKNAFYFCALWMIFGFAPPVALAVILQEIPLGRVMFRVLFYIPAVVSGVVILFMWRAIYDPSPDGILNRIISFFGGSAQQWLQDPNLAMICVVFPLAWAGLGPSSIIYLAALKGIPDELYEASDIDGAVFFDKLRYIVFPYMKPLLVINAVGATIYGFKSGDAILAMTGGGPNGATQVVGYEIWQRTFLFLKFGQGTAMAWILGLILLSFTAYQMRILARVEFRTTQK